MLNKVEKLKYCKDILLSLTYLAAREENAILYTVICQRL